MFHKPRYLKSATKSYIFLFCSNDKTVSICLLQADKSDKILYKKAMKIEINNKSLVSKSVSRKHRKYLFH